MANIQQAIDFVLRQEDSTLSGVITDILSDAGGSTRFGITQKAAPGLSAQGFFTLAIPADRALTMAESWYQTHYANPLYLDQIESQGIANALFSYAINQEGPGSCGEAVKVLQQACMALGSTIAVDGVMGPDTVAAINHLQSLEVLKEEGNLELAVYRAIVQNNPQDAKFWTGWQDRAEQDAGQTA